MNDGRPLLLLASPLCLAALIGCGGTSSSGDPSPDLTVLAVNDLAMPTGCPVPLAGTSSMGMGGEAPVAGVVRKVGDITYRLIVPDNVEWPSPLLLVYSGTEGGANMTYNLTVAGPASGTDRFVKVVLDGVVYRGDPSAGAAALDDVRAQYDIDNDRTYLLGESAGTSAALKLGFEVRQSWFAAYWANDVNDNGAPAQTAEQLCFEPWGQVGPGGDFLDAEIIVQGMRDAGYRLPDPAPYNGRGAGTHGDKYQFVAALQFFVDKTRQ